jgi:anti-anti-sigma factor
MKLFGVELHEQPGGVRVELTGEIDLSVIDDLERRLAPALEQAPDPLVIDLRAVEFLDSSGLRLLIALNEKTQADGRRFTLIAAGDPVARVLELAGIDDRLEILSDPAELA